MKYYICETNSRSGIARYAEDFYACILSTKGYVLISPRDVTAEFLCVCEPETTFFIELGAGQYAEKEALMRIIISGFVNIRATLHDPPFLTFPYFNFRNDLLNRVFRGVDYYLGGFGMASRALRRCQRVYVLSSRGEMRLRRRYKNLNVVLIPHIIHPGKIANTTLAGNEMDILFLGFVGHGKGLDYALEFHAEIIKHYPESVFHVVGEAANDAGRAYLGKLKNKYKYNVCYHGYVSEEQLDKIFSRVAHVFLPFHEYKYITPVSGAVLNSMRRGKIVWTTAVNSVAEIIRDGETGFFFRDDMRENMSTFCKIAETPGLAKKISGSVLAAVSAASSMQAYHSVE